MRTSVDSTGSTGLTPTPKQPLVYADELVTFTAVDWEPLRERLDKYLDGLPTIQTEVHFHPGWRKAYSDLIIRQAIEEVFGPPKR